MTRSIRPYKVLASIIVDDSTRREQVTVSSGSGIARWRHPQSEQLEDPRRNVRQHCMAGDHNSPRHQKFRHQRAQLVSCWHHSHRHRSRGEWLFDSFWPAWLPMPFAMGILDLKGNEPKDSNATVSDERTADNGLAHDCELKESLGHLFLQSKC